MFSNTFKEPWFYFCMRITQRRKFGKLRISQNCLLLKYFPYCKLLRKHLGCFDFQMRDTDLLDKVLFLQLANT